MFIAVINENFDVAEEQKRSQQATHYWSTHQVQAGRATWVRRLNPYRWFKANPVKVKVENLPSNLVLPMQQALYSSGASSRSVHVRWMDRLRFIYLHIANVTARKELPLVPRTPNAV
jgi:hypothetical protein